MSFPRVQKLKAQRDLVRPNLRYEFNGVLQGSSSVLGENRYESAPGRKTNARLTEDELRRFQILSAIEAKDR